MTATKQQLIKQVQTILDLLNFGTDPISELTDALEMLEDPDCEVSLDEVFNESIFGCDTGSSRLIQIGYETEKLEEMVRLIQSELDEAIEAFEDSI
jgi:hypothetical protein